MTSMRCSWTRRRHSAPEIASIAPKPSRCRWRARIDTVSGSSSTTIICGIRLASSIFPSSLFHLVLSARRKHAATPQFGGKGGALEPQQFGRRLLVAAGLLQRLIDHSPFELAHERVEINPIGPDRGRDARLGEPAAADQIWRQQGSVDYRVLAHDNQALDHVHQFTYVARPIVGP